MATIELAESIATHARGCTYDACLGDGTVGSRTCENRIRAKVVTTIGIKRAEEIITPDALDVAVQYARIQCRCDANIKKTQAIIDLCQGMSKKPKH